MTVRQSNAHQPGHRFLVSASINLMVNLQSAWLDCAGPWCAVGKPKSPRAELFIGIQRRLMRGKSLLMRKPVQNQPAVSEKTAAMHAPGKALYGRVAFINGPRGSSNRMFACWHAQHTAAGEANLANQRRYWLEPELNRRHKDFQFFNQLCNSSHKFTSVQQ